MPHDKRSVINLALLELGQSELLALGTGQERELVMAGQWESCKRVVAESAYWNVLQKTESLSYTPGDVPAPGYLYVIHKPDGWYRTMWIKASVNSRDEIDYLDEGGVWFTNYETVVCRWIDQTAIDDAFIAAWPELFVECVAYKLAERCAKRLTASDEAKKEAERRYLKALSRAAAVDAMNQPSEDTGRATGSWNAARRGARHSGWTA